MCCLRCIISALSLLLHAFVRSRYEEYFSDPTLDVRNDRMNACKNIEKVH